MTSSVAITGLVPVIPIRMALLFSKRDDGGCQALSVMAGLVPAIHVFTPPRKGVDPRDKPGGDGGVSRVMAYR
jgi:hypothetical protein